MPADSLTVTRDVPFAHPDTGPLLLNLYHPGSPVAPVVLWLHGGGWFTGDRTLAPDLSAHFARRGIAMASIDYRLTPGSVFPAQLHDVRSAIRWLRRSSAELSLDPRRIGVWGSSAGGHLAALGGLTGRHDRLAGEAEAGDASVAAVAESYGPTDLTIAPATGPSGRPTPEAALIGGPPSERPDSARAASPLTHVTAGAPPFQISHGTADVVVDQSHGERLHAALVAAGVESTLYLVDGYRHGFLNPGGRMEADLGPVMDDGRLDREGRAPAVIRRPGTPDRPATFGFDDVGDFFAHHLTGATS